MTQQRYTADTITDDALDALYENATRGWRRGDGWKSRAEQAEAAIERVRAALHVADEDDVTDWQRGYRACSRHALAALIEPKE